MKLKTLFAGAALLLFGAQAMALRTTQYAAEFQTSTLDPTVLLPLDFVRPDGFGRSDLTGEPQALTALSASDDAFTPGVLPFGFHDIWSFSGLAPGSYQFNTTLPSTGTLAFGLVLFEWYSQGAFHSIDFTVAPGGASAQGSGTFVVDAGCALTNCVVLHIWGWDDGVRSGNYAGQTAVTSVPEPESWALMLAGVGALAVLAWRRRRAR